VIELPRVQSSAAAGVVNWGGRRGYFTAPPGRNSSPRLCGHRCHRRGRDGDAVYTRSSLRAISRAYECVAPPAQCISSIKFPGCAKTGSRARGREDRCNFQRHPSSEVVVANLCKKSRSADTGW